MQPEDEPTTLTDDEIETRPLGTAAGLQAADDSDTGDDGGDDSGDDTGDPTDATDTGDDSGDDAGR
jgi:hypothetical protein